MCRSVVFLFIAAVVSYSPCSVCRCSEQKRPAQITSTPGTDLANPAVFKFLLGESVQVNTTDHFTIVHQAGVDYIPATGNTLEEAYTEFYEAFSQAGFGLTRSPDRLVWVCFPQQSKFNEYATRVEGVDLSWLDGYYSTLTNRVAVVEPSPRVSDYDGTAAAPKPGGWASKQDRDEILPMSTDESRVDVVRLTHELAHQLAFNSGLQKRGVMYPFWVSEGLATNFEFERLTGVSLANRSTARRDCLIKSHASGELAPLAQFVVQTNVPANGDESRRYYAQAWAFFQYLLTERSEGLRSYLHRAATLPPGRRSATVLLREFTDAFGSPEDMESSWKAFLDRQVRLAHAARSGTYLTRHH